jgi:phage-related protein
MNSGQRKPLHFVGSSIKDLRAMPEDVQDVFGSALLDAQYGDHPKGARPFGEGLPRSVMKLIEDHDSNTFRAAFTVSFPEAVYVLHVFKKKSRSGVGTPRPDKEVIRVRLEAAEQHHKQFYGERRGRREGEGGHER